MESVPTASIEHGDIVLISWFILFDLIELSLHVVVAGVAAAETFTISAD